MSAQLPRIAPAKRRELNRWANLMRTQAERDFAFRLLNFHDWAEVMPLDRGRVTIKRAAAITAELWAQDPWPGCNSLTLSGEQNP